MIIDEGNELCANSIQDGPGILRRNAEEHTRGAFWLSPPLFPIAKGGRTDSEKLSKLLLRKPQVSTDLQDIRAVNSN